jgi:hypothetical protein
LFGGSLAASAALLSVHKIGNQATHSRIAWLPEGHNLMGICCIWGNAFTLILRFFRHEVAENMFAEERTLDPFAHTGYQNGFDGHGKPSIYGECSAESFGEIPDSQRLAEPQIFARFPDRALM